MIIATALKSVFEGLTVSIPDFPNRSIQFHYGDQKELNLWVDLKGNLNKYPLIWYVLGPWVELNGWYETDAKWVIMTSTRAEKLNTWRRDNSYVTIIDPVWNAAKDLILQNQYIEVPAASLRDRFQVKDEPNYGINSSFETSEVPSGEQSVTTDIVDARIVRCRLRLKADCIIKN